MGRVEGILLWHELKSLPTPPLPTRGWTFPDEKTAALRVPGGYIVIGYNPQSPFLTFAKEVAEGPPLTPFQRVLAQRARGELLGVFQSGLDRLVVFNFAGEEGFVGTPPALLVFEAAGRNANLVLLDKEKRIVAADRHITREKNRYREVLPGRPYLPPPPYEKLDPRGPLSPEDLPESVGSLPRRIDGLSPRLARALAERAGVPADRPLSKAEKEKLLFTLKKLVTDKDFARSLKTEEKKEPGEERRKALLLALEKERKTLEKRLEDHKKNLARKEAARIKRHLGDLIMANLYAIKKGDAEANLIDFETGERVRVELDPDKTPVENARAYYEAAKRDEAAAKRASELLALTEENLKKVLAEIEEVKRLSPAELRERFKKRPEKAPAVGLRYLAPGGFEVWVGRNARENEALLGLARSEDLWFHAQGVPGSHVILRTQGKPPPLEALLFAAQLAAYHSKARGEKSAPVDYTKRKYVRKVKKAPPGTVVYSQAKTLFVDANPPEV